MGRLDSNPPPQSSDATPPQGYPNHHNNPLSPPPPPPPPQNGYIADSDQQSTRSFVPQSPQNMPPPESYPPVKPTSYPPQQQPAAAYPPQQQPAAAYPTQQQPAAAYPPPQQPEPVAFPPQQNYSYNAQPQAVNYQAQTVYHTPMNNMGPPSGIAVGTQYLNPTQGWRNGLFDCAEDPENAFITACFPCITFGQIAEIVDNGQTSCATSGLIYGLIAAFIGCPCIMSCGYRTKIRNRYGLMETPAPDWATHLFCEWCALCQEYRELKAQGLDPAIGWQGNMARNQQQMQHYPTTTPPINQTMM